MDKVSPEGRDNSARREPVNDTPPDAITVWYNPTIKRCVVVVRTGTPPPSTGTEREIEVREGQDNSF